MINYFRQNYSGILLHILVARYLFPRSNFVETLLAVVPSFSKVMAPRIANLFRARRGKEALYLYENECRCDFFLSILLALVFLGAHVYL
jgi:hypothetical protein